LALTLLCPALQAEQESGYYKKPGYGEIQFIQRLSWPANENVSQYELEIERREERDSFTGAYRIITGENSAEFSLPPGNYRFRVILYNLLRQPEYTAPWVGFEILLALQPELRGFRSRTSIAKQGEALELVIEGRNLLPEMEIRLERRGQSFSPRSYRLDPSGERAVLLYYIPNLAWGKNYTIRVTNPGGLESSLPGFWVDHSTSFQLLLAYAPVLPAGGYIFELFDNGFYPKGAQARAAWLPLKVSWGSLGLEAAFGWNYLEARRNLSGLTAHFGELGLNALYRRELNRHFAFKARAGGGFSGMLNLVFDYGDIQSGGYNTISPMAGIGGSLEWLLYRYDFSRRGAAASGTVFSRGGFSQSLYAELGLDGFFVFSKDTPQNVYLRPFAGLGWRY
jgi:hypothetical protein